MEQKQSTLKSSGDGGSSPACAHDIVAIERDQLLARNLVTGLAVSVVNSVILSGVLAAQTSVAVLAAWFVSLFIVNAVRASYLRLVLNTRRAFSRGEMASIIVLTAIGGVLWGAPAFFASPVPGSAVAAVIIFMVAGMTAAAGLAYATHLKVVFAFNLPPLAFFFLHFVSRGDAVDYVMAGVLVMYFIATLSIAKRLGRTIEDAIENRVKADERSVELERNECALAAEVEARKQSEDRIKTTLQRNRKFNSALEDLFKISVAADRSAHDLIIATTKTISRQLGVERVGVWQFTKERDAVVCANMYIAAMDAHEGGARMEAADYPKYFSLLRESRIVDVSDAQADPRTKEFTENYFKPKNIQSTIDAPIRGASDVRGVVRCEKVGERRSWTNDEMTFVASAAQIISMSLLAEDSRNLAQALQGALIDAEQASAAKSTFLATMSHEIRTPLNGVLGAASLLRQFELNDEARSFVEIVHESGQTLLDLLNDVLDISKFEAGGVDLEDRSFDVGEVFDRVAKIYRMKALEKDIEFTATIEDGLAVRRMGDPHRITQVLHNLLSNAVKFTIEGSVVASLSAGAEGEAGEDIIVLSIEDTGIGMNEEELAKSFEPFAQADCSTTRKYGGTGLGVPIVKNIVEAMHGELRVCSEPGVGTRFDISLPLALSENDCAATSEEREKRLHRKLCDASILIAEDNETNRLIMSAFLNKTGAALTFASNGLEAVEHFSMCDFDVVLMDIQMPMMDGEEALRRIRLIERDRARLPTPVVAITADVLEEQVQNYRAIGFDDFLPKPVNEHGLLQALTENLGAPKPAAVQPLPSDIKLSASGV